MFPRLRIVRLVIKPVIRRVVLTGLLVLPLLNSGCGKKSISTGSEAPNFAISCIAVSSAVSAVDLDGELVSAIEKKELEAGLYFLNKSLKKHFIRRNDVRQVSDGLFSDMKKYSDMRPLERAKAVADRLSCNAVLETTIHRYRERVGGGLTAKEPASVAFDYRLLAMPDGKVLCRDSFDAEQQSLMANLWSLSSGTGGTFTWLSAEQFLMQGLRNRLNNCSYLVSD
jgi:hypothetical protein